MEEEEDAEKKNEDNMRLSDVGFTAGVRISLKGGAAGGSGDEQGGNMDGS